MFSVRIANFVEIMPFMNLSATIPLIMITAGIAGTNLLLRYHRFRVLGWLVYYQERRDLAEREGTLPIEKGP